jgi:cation diffusion facilitator CzcD-associated flavoprotein CzcO
MSFSDAPFAYGPFVPHHIPRQYLENYVSIHKIDTLLSLNTTVEDISLISSPKEQERWKLTLRKYDGARHVDIWWSEEFDAVILANGHYAVPFVSRPLPIQDLQVFMIFRYQK